MKPNIWVTKKSSVSLRNKITNDWGKRCPKFFTLCHVCMAHLAVDILTDLYKFADE